MCERNGYCQIFNVTTTEPSIEAQKECKCQTNFYIKQQQQLLFQQKQKQSHHSPAAAATTNVNMQPQKQKYRIHHMQMSANHNISPTSSHTSSSGSSTIASSSSPPDSHYSSSDNGGGGGCSGTSSPTPSATSSTAQPSIGVNLRVTGQCSQGGRKYMEDYFSVAYQQSENAKDLEYAFIGIYDGHGGAEAATFAKEHLMMEIINQKLFWSESDEDVLRAIREGYIATHFAMWRDQEKWPRTPNNLPSTAGTTATVAFIRREKIYIGHVGDSGIVLGYQNEGENFWRSKQLTTDHKPESLQERTRIMRSGGKVVVKSGVPRVVWNRPRNADHKGPIRCTTPVDEIPFLAVARSLGDLWSFNLAHNEFVVSPDPDVKVVKIDPKTFRCLIFGTDGLWNVVSAQEATDTVYEKEAINQRLQQQRGDSPTEGAHGQWTNPSKGLVDKALRTWSSKKMRADNTSVVTVILYPPSGGLDAGATDTTTTIPTAPHSYGLHYAPLNTTTQSYEVQQFTLNDPTTYQEIASKYLPPEQFRNYNNYQEEEVEEETPEEEQQPKENPLYTTQPNASAFWGAVSNATTSEEMYATHGALQQPQQSNSWHWQDACANIEPHATHVAHTEHMGVAALVSKVAKTNLKTSRPEEEVMEDVAAEEESSTDEEEDDDDEEEEEDDMNDANDSTDNAEDSVSDYDTDGVKNFDWGIVLSAKNQRNMNLTKNCALTTSTSTPQQQLHEGEAHMATTSYAHYNAAMDNAIPAPHAPTYLSSFAETYNSLLSEQMSQTTIPPVITSAIANNSCCSTTSSSSSSSSNSNEATAAGPAGSYQSLSGSSMHEILQEQQRYQQQCMSEEDGYSLTKLETRRATASGAGGVQTFKIFQQQQDAATASYHVPISTLTGDNATSEMWQQRFPAVSATYARCLPHLTTSASTTAASAAVKPLELHALLQQEREEEQQVALEQLERQRKLADTLAGVCAGSDDDGDVDCDDEPLMEEYLEEELEEIAKVAVQINEISSSCADEASGGAEKHAVPCAVKLTDATPLAGVDSNATLTNERLEHIEILHASAEMLVADIEASPTIPPTIVHKVALQSPYAMLYKTTHTRRTFNKHKQPALNHHHYPNIPNENQHLSITASTHALCTKRAYATASAASSSNNGAASSALAGSRSASALDKRQLRSTAACGIDYSKRTLRTRNSLAKDMKAKTTLASTLKRSAAATPQFLRTTAVSMMGAGGGAPTRSRSTSVLAAGSSASSSSQNGNRKPTKPERLAAAAAAFSAAAHTHAFNLRSRQVASGGGQVTAVSAKGTAAASNSGAAAAAAATTLHTPAHRRERRNLRSLAAATSSKSVGAKEAATTPTMNFSKSTRLQSSAGSALAAPPPSPKLINAAAAVAAATRARSLLAKTAAVIAVSTSSSASGASTTSSSAAAAAGVYSKRLSLRSGSTPTSAVAAAVCAALRSRGLRKQKR